MPDETFLGKLLHFIVIRKIFSVSYDYVHIDTFMKMIGIKLGEAFVIYVAAIIHDTPKIC